MEKCSQDDEGSLFDCVDKREGKKTSSFVTKKLWVSSIFTWFILRDSNLKMKDWIYEFGIIV